MPRPLIFRRKRTRTEKLLTKELDPKTLIEAKMTFHTNVLSIVKALFACLFVFAATPIAILSSLGIEKHKENIFELTYIVSLTMYFCLTLFLLYAIIILSRGKDKNSKSFISKIDEANAWICCSSIVLIMIIIKDLFSCISRILKQML